MAAKHHPWMKWETKTWLTDPLLRKCGPASRGVLADLMCLGDDGTPYGFLTNSGIPLVEKDLRDTTKTNYQTLRKIMGELYRWRRINHVTISKTHALSFGWSTDDPLILWASRGLAEIVGPYDDPIIFVPRVVKDGVKHLMGVEFGKKGGNPELLKGLTPGVNPKGAAGVNPEREGEEDKDVERGDNPRDGRSGPGGPGVRRGEKGRKQGDPGAVPSILSKIFHQVFDKKESPPDKQPGKG